MATDSKTEIPAQPEAPSKKSEGKKRSRKDRYKVFDEKYQFTTQDKLIYFAKIGGPILAGVLVVGALGFWLTGSFRRSVRPDSASVQLEEDALVLMGKAAEAERLGNAILAAEHLRTIIRKYPGTTARQRADELLERHKVGATMFVDSRKDPVRPTVVRNHDNIAIVDPREAKAKIDTKKATVAKPVAKKEDPVEKARQEAIAKALAVKPQLELDAKLAPRKLPDGFRADFKAGIHISGWPAEIVCGRDGSAMALIPHGEFTMGSGDGPPNERPAHAVAVGAFYIDKFEITHQQYQRYLELHVEAPRLADETMAAMPSPRHPVVGVTREQADKYCRWAGKRLPLEAQWEKAACGAARLRFPWGNDAGLAPAGRKPQSIEPILSHPADRSPFAVFDLSGNAGEWCDDWYLDDAYQRDDAVTGKGPPSPSIGNERVVRGAAPDGTITWRGKLPEDQSALWLGFRGVLDVEAFGEGRPKTTVRNEGSTKQSNPIGPIRKPAEAPPPKAEDDNPKGKAKAKPNQEPVRPTTKSGKPKKSRAKPNSTPGSSRGE